MTKDDIIALPNPSLRKPSQKVPGITPEITKLITDMKAAAMDWEASRDKEVTVGLAAVQVDRHHKVFIVREDFKDASNHDFMVFINPEILKLDGKVITEHEGCLSVRGFYGMVPRHERCKIKALDEKGQEFTLKAEGFIARILQHETDHTKGKLFVDHIENDEGAFLTFDEKGEFIKADYQDVVDAGILR